MKAILVDDEEDIRKIGQMSLQALGQIETRTACSAKEAFQLARLEQPDVMIMDMMMPEMDGATALQVMLKDETLKQIPVIFFTARVQKQDVDRYLALGAAGVIQKPFDPMTLAAQVKRIIMA